MNLSGKIGIQDVLRIYPGLFLRTVPLPVDQILQDASSTPGVKKFSHLVRFLSLDLDGLGTLLMGPPLSLLSRGHSGLEQRYMKSGRDAIGVR